MHWNKEIRWFAKSSRDGVETLLAVHDARDEATRHGLESSIRRWAV